MTLVRQFFLAAVISGFLAVTTAAQASTNTTAPRVVSLAPSLTELVFALGLGDHLVGRSSACDYPPEAAGLPIAGDFGRPQLEVLEALKPDMVLAMDVEKPGLLRRLEEMGVSVQVLPCESWTELLGAARRVGRALGQPERGEAWARGMEARRDALAKQVAATHAGRERPRIYVEVWSDPLTTVSRSTFVHDLVELAGARNIASDLRGLYVHISAEWVIQEDPDAILMTYMMAGSGGADSLVRRPGWGTIRAVQNSSICTTIPPDWLLRPGPRMIQGAEALAAWLEQQPPPERAAGR